MPFIRVIPHEQAEAPLKEQYDTALKTCWQDLEYCWHHEPESGDHESFHRYLSCDHVRTFTAEPFTKGKCLQW